YATLLNENPVDIVCLGIGENGHIAFNDPPVADFNDPKLVKVVDLEQICRQQQVNDNCFTAIELVPEKAFSLTIPALMRASYMFCIVPTLFKAEAVRKTLNDAVSEKCPATILRTKEDAFLYLDADSASLLNN
ncbi:MAG: 6-phosphogluconolactonase, partial [Proteiniphilum sp.]|nr:6-phosphogluconolactonase [Proteiniphilum sp.]